MIKGLVKIASISLGLLAVCALGGCVPQVLQTTKSGGIIRTAGSFKQQAKSIQIADAECAKFGKLSKITKFDILSNTATYDCVDK